VGFKQDWRLDMFVNYIYCPYCGYEDFEVFVSLYSTPANGDFYICPSCGDATSNVEKD